jgi:hypothetical protein
MTKQPFEYDDESFDFGFTTVSEIDFKTRENQVAKQVEQQVTASSEEKMQKLEKLILPLLYNLKKNSEQEYIRWPNREDIINKQIEKITAITRSS